MESKTQNKKVIVEIHFYATPYHTLLRWLDWRGILLKAHINWLRQKRTHCSLRISAGGEDLTYQATWDGLLVSKYEDIKYIPVDVLDVTHLLNTVTVLDNIGYLYKYARYERITLDTMLLLMKGRAREVKDITCTSFIADCLGIRPLKYSMLYPDNFYNGILEWLNG